MDGWPWHFHYEDGRYLSEKRRVCNVYRAATFNSPLEAREFYTTWKHHLKYRMELIEYSFFES